MRHRSPRGTAWEEFSSPSVAGTLNGDPQILPNFGLTDTVRCIQGIATESLAGSGNETHAPIHASQ